MDETGHTSVVLHVDLDCFYAAVEQVRLGIPKEQPLAVQQWEGLIAVNYAARAAGIVRHERMSDALRKCPDLHLVHVETIGGCKPGTPESVGPSGKAKVSLERYRQASAKVFSIFRRYSKLCERASIDEAYLDVSDQVEEMLEKDNDWESELQRLLEPAGENGTSSIFGGPVMVVEGGSLATFNSYDRRLLAGAIIADQVRASVRNELGYSCSVGIASNKLLAKIASAKNKPDRQTLIPPRAVPGLMQDLPLKKIKLLGGKLGQDMKNRWGCTTAGEAQKIPLTALAACFGDRLGTYAWRAVRGLKAEKVQVKDLVKSMLAAKSFSATNEFSTIRQWLGVLAQELAIRMRRDFEQNQRQPKLFQLYYRSGLFKNSADHSKSVPMPPTALHILSSPSYDEVEDKSVEGENTAQTDLFTGGEGDGAGEVEGEVEVHGDMSELREDLIGDGPSVGSVQGAITERTRALGKFLEDTSFRVLESVKGLFPCTRLALAASSFQDLPGQGTKSIQHFFTSSTRSSSAPHRANITASDNSNGSSSAVSLSDKPKGILRYLSPNTTSPTIAHDEHEMMADCRMAMPQTTALSQYPNEKNETRPCTAPAELDGNIDLEAVNVEEQRLILERINRSNQVQSKDSALQAAKKGRSQAHRVSSNKRAREHTSTSQPKQPSIGTYFGALEKL